MLERIRELIGAEDDTGEGVPEPAEVKSAIRETEEELEAARGRLSKLNEEHGRVLLHGSDEDVDEHEAAIQKAEREVTRLEVAIPRLEDELEKAEEAAAEREKERKLARGVELSEEFGDLNDRYRELVAQIVPVVERMEEIEREVERLQDGVGTGPNRELVPPGREAYHRNQRPWRDNVIVPAGPESPRLRASRWRKPHKTPSRSSSSEEDREVSVTDAETGEATLGVGRRGRRQRVVSEGI